MRRPSCLALAAALATPGAVGAQEAGTVPDAAGLKALEASVPPQSWYPEGYYDVRIAAEAQVAEFPAPAAMLPATADDDYYLIACDLESIGVDWGDPLLARYGDVALETARLRTDLARLHYPVSLYGEPLLAFERERIVEDMPKDDAYAALAAALEAKRAGSALELPPVVAFDDCTPPPPPPPPPPPAMDGAPPKPAKTGAAKPVANAPRPAAAAVTPGRAAGVTFATQPTAGEVLLISAFAFKVCVRKHPDPWDRFACRWNEIQTGVAKPMSGRFVYQVRWPDGTVRKGTREILSGEAGSITFRKVGS